MAPSLQFFTGANCHALRSECLIHGGIIFAKSFQGLEKLNFCDVGGANRGKH